ncbi:hypothetical protein HUO09_17810 [Vibrio sp. Y2-5]|uniref:hypothetical protein n=1 Tax=Vibrio sp. Y2-5 TaxID=2743977 RepID=UPI0016614DFA|nr:hypothetical protein [Vibrio sp. Y2-5]MBD0788215.1 hypothetical protein [Vibrio sp. Y2-5]
MIVSDVSGLFIMPLAVTMQNAAYSLFNELGIIFIPFTVVIVQTFFAVRASGADDGSPAVMFIKLLEKEFITKFFILFVAVMPISHTAATFTYKQYSHQTTPSVFKPNATATQLAPTSAYSSVLGKGQVPLIVGLINNMALGLSNSLTASIACTPTSGKSDGCIQDVTQTKLAEALITVQSNNASTRKVVTEFERVCHAPAIERYLTAKQMVDDTSLYTGAYPNNSNSKYGFNSTLMKGVYQGSIGVDSSNNYDQMTIDTSDIWPTSISKKENVKCQDAARVIWSVLWSELKQKEAYNDYYAPLMTAWIEMFSRYSGDSTSPKEMIATEATAQNEFVNAMYINSYNESFTEYNFLNSVDGFVFRANRFLADHGINIEIPFLPGILSGLFSHDTEGLLEDGNVGGYALQIAKNAIHLYANITGAVGAYTKYEILIRIMPVLIQTAVGSIVMFSPIIIVLSGYNPKVTYRVLLMMFGVLTSTYVFELGLVLGNTILQAATDFSFRINAIGSRSDSVEESLAVWLGLALPVVMVLLWNIALQIAGTMNFPFKPIMSPSDQNLMKSKELKLLMDIGFNEDMIAEAFKAPKDAATGLTQEEMEAIRQGHIEGFKKGIRKLSRKQVNTLIKNSKKL